MLPVFDEATPSIGTIDNWFKKFRSGDFSIEDEPRTGRPSELDNNALLLHIRDNPRSNVRQIAEEFQCHYSTVDQHLGALGFTKQLGRWIPHRLTEDQLENRVTICNSLLSRKRNFEWLRELVTGDEKWVLYFNQTRQANGLCEEKSLNPTQNPTPMKKSCCSQFFGIIREFFHSSFYNPILLLMLSIIVINWTDFIIFFLFKDPQNAM